jgi:NTP pyrophosphatase (non-canonical NTP hydrolase)
VSLKKMGIAQAIDAGVLMPVVCLNQHEQQASNGKGATMNIVRFNTPNGPVAIFVDSVTMLSSSSGGVTLVTTSDGTKTYVNGSLDEVQAFIDAAIDTPVQLTSEPPQATFRPAGGPKRPQYEPRGVEACLGYLVEECGEVLQAAGKSLRWGLESYNPELPPGERETNRTWLLREIADLEAAIARLHHALTGEVGSIRSSSAGAGR